MCSGRRVSSEWASSCSIASPGFYFVSDPHSARVSKYLCKFPCRRSGAGFEGHSTENPLGAVVPSEFIVMISHTLRTVNGIVRSSSRSNRRERGFCCSFSSPTWVTR